MSAFAWRRARSVAAVVTAVVLAGGAAACSGPEGGPAATEPSTSAGTPSGTPSPTPVPTTAKPKPATGNPLTGGKVSGNPVIAVKVENTSAARPQVGLSPADIVFVQEVEGAQTRLVAVYHSRLPTRLGPVRSARTTDAQLLPLFGKPGLVYSGANGRVQRKLDGASLVPVFRLTRDRRRVAPHNVFVDLQQVARTEKLGEARPIGWTFAGEPGQRGRRPDDTVVSKVGNDTFGFAYARGRYTVTWRGARYVDGDNGAVAKADNVVVMRVRNVPDGNRDVLGSASVLSETVGKGKVTVYRDGVKIDGAWSRSKSTAPLRFTDARGRDIALKPGQTWVTLQG
ncbi:MAG TPA: DUF3048 domain-containing protein [Propionibacteriaceae bacterium]|nr:DUF3048 domain-containing protein [Propionibacteriaceae bacterium]